MSLISLALIHQKRYINVNKIMNCIKENIKIKDKSLTIELF